MGIAAGLAIGTKYSGIIILMVLSLFFFVAFVRERKLKPVVHLAVILALSLLVGGWRYLDNIRSEGRLFAGNEAWQHVEGKDRKFYFKEYEFHTFKLRELVFLMSAESPQQELKYFEVYNHNVLTSLFGQIWTDCSIFSNPSRHGLEKGLYPDKSIPIALVAALLCMGIVPVVLGGAGLIESICRAKQVPLLVLGGISVLVYTRWFLGHPEWALKTKYLFQVIPAGLVFCSVGLSSLGRRSAYAEKIAVGMLLLLIVLANTYNLFFAIT
jgi:4-amino-4-deoxy-L-arabinose transferase-like glycosyltransferase